MPHEGTSMSSLSDLLTEKLAAEGLSIGQAAEKLGVAQPSFRKVVNGASVPNARSIEKYATFLGKSVEELKSLATASRDSAGKPKAAKAKRTRGSGKAKSGRGRKSRKSSGGDVAAALDTIRGALEAAQNVLSDDLAMLVANADPSKRKAIGAIIKAFA
jgi:transcriptional regulator with XRE-family HTH domain